MKPYIEFVETLQNSGFWLVKEILEEIKRSLYCKAKWLSGAIGFWCKFWDLSCPGDQGYFLGLHLSGSVALSGAVPGASSGL